MTAAWSHRVAVQGKVTAVFRLTDSCGPTDGGYEQTANGWTGHLFFFFLKKKQNTDVRVH